MEILTLLAIFAGPTLAVMITRIIDHMREKHNRRMEIFKTLMRTRRTPIYPEHVGALNLIEIEFSKDTEVIDYWTQLFEHLGKEHNRRKNEQAVDEDSSERVNKKEEKFHERLANERQSLLAKLLHAMAKSLNFKIEQLEIFEGGYTPTGWANLDLEQQVARKFIVDLYLGKKVLPIGVLDYTQLKHPQNEDGQSQDGNEEAA